MTLRPSRGPIQLPKAPENVPLDPKFFNSVVRAIEQQFQSLYQLNNNPFLIDPTNTVSTSIAGNTASATKVRDFLLTVTNALKSGNKLN